MEVAQSFGILTWTGLVPTLPPSKAREASSTTLNVRILYGDAPCAVKFICVHYRKEEIMAEIISDRIFLY